MILDDTQKKLLLNTQAGVAITGAGISAASGIPTFRGQNGLYVNKERQNVVPDYLYYSAFLENPDKTWEGLLSLVHAKSTDVAPNEGHFALRGLQDMGVIGGIVTQNVDGLHHAAGSRSVIEMHGSVRHIKCCNCHMMIEASLDQMRNDKRLRRCSACGGLSKPNVVLFGEQIYESVYGNARDMINNAGFLLLIGTSAQVDPLRFFIKRYKNFARPIIEINIAKTALSSVVSDVFIEGRAELILPQLLSEFKTWA